MNIPAHNFYMNIVDAVALGSHAERAKVGAILVKNGNIVAFGYNGTPSGFSNTCEMELPNSLGPGTIVTKPEVLHAESNAIAKCAKSTASSNGTVMYCTYSPCFECAKLIIQAGIKEVIYSIDYREPDGHILLQNAGIKIVKLIR